MGNMIASGVFLLPTSLAPYGWNAIFGWAATIIGVMILAYVLAQLTRRLPDSSGPIDMVRIAFGPTAAFTIGWSYWVSVWTSNVTIAIGAASYLSLFIRPIRETPGMGAVTAFILIWLLTFLNLRGAGTVGRFQMVTLILKLIPLLIVAALISLILARSGTSSLLPYHGKDISLSGITATAALALWALCGFEVASAAADKVHDPARTIVRATLIGTFAAGLIYFFVCSGIALMLPPDVAQHSDAPFADFVMLNWSSGPANFVGLFAAISAIGALNGWILIQGEVPLAMARTGQLPGWFAKTDARGTPARALILSSALASILLLANSLRAMADIFTFMALLATAASLWLYLACAAAALRLKIAMPAALVGLLYAMWTLWGAGGTASGLSVLLMLSGLPLYWWTKRKQKIERPAA